MTNTKREGGSHRQVYLCAVAALGLALSACGGGPAGSASQASGLGGGTALASGSAGDTNGTADVSSGGGKAVTINWMPPTENTDGTALMDLAGYAIHYGPASGYYTQTISVSNPGIATYVVDDLAPGTYYFSVAAVNSAGTESPLSTEVKATVN